MTPQERRAEQVERLEAATRELMAGDGFSRYVRARKAFHAYSLNNQLLIAMQIPMVGEQPSAEFATRVAGFNTWKNKLDRKVVKGAKGLRIFAPVKFKDKNDLDEDGKPKEKMTFKVVSVFDVSQTEGEPLAELPQSSIAGAEHADLLDALAMFATDKVDGLGLTLDEVDLSARPEGGWYDRLAERIVIDSTTTTDEKVRVLTHELAHALGVGYEDYGREGAEVIVEAAATIALDAFGFDTSGASLGYIASWGEEDGLAALRTDLGKIDEVASKIEAAVEKAVSREKVAA